MHEQENTENVPEGRSDTRTSASVFTLPGEGLTLSQTPPATLFIHPFLTEARRGILTWKYFFFPCLSLGFLLVVALLFHGSPRAELLPAFSADLAWLSAGANPALAEVTTSSYSLLLHLKDREEFKAT